MHAFDRQTDGQTDGQTEFSSLDRVCVACSAVKTVHQKMVSFQLVLEILWRVK